MQKKMKLQLLLNLMIIIELMRIDSQIIIRCSIKNGGLVPFLDDTLVYTGIWILEEVFGDIRVNL